LGTFTQPIEVGDFDGKRFEPVEAMVDTGASYTFIPSDLLQRLGVEPQEVRPFILANGQQVEYALAWVRVKLDGREQPTPVIFGEPGSQPLLGAVTLEEFGLAADPVNRRLVPAPLYLVGIRDASTT
jgi:aspartyl protease family protein